MASEGRRKRPSLKNLVRMFRIFRMFRDRRFPQAVCWGHESLHLDEKRA